MAEFIYQNHVVIDHSKYTLLRKVLECLSTLLSRMTFSKIQKHKTTEAILLNKKIWNGTDSKGQSNQSRKTDIVMVILIWFESKCAILDNFKLRKTANKLSLFH